MTVTPTLCISNVTQEHGNVPSSVLIIKQCFVVHSTYSLKDAQSRQEHLYLISRRPWKRRAISVLCLPRITIGGCKFSQRRVQNRLEDAANIHRKYMTEAALID